MIIVRLRRRQARRQMGEGDVWEDTQNPSHQTPRTQLGNPRNTQGVGPQRLYMRRHRNLCQARCRLESLPCQPATPHAPPQKPMGPLDALRCPVLSYRSWGWLWTSELWKELDALVCRVVHVMYITADQCGNLAVGVEVQKDVVRRKHMLWCGTARTTWPSIHWDTMLFGLLSWRGAAHSTLSHMVDPRRTAWRRSRIGDPREEGIRICYTCGMTRIVQGSSYSKAVAFPSWASASNSFADLPKSRSIR